MTSTAEAATAFRLLVDAKNLCMLHDASADQPLRVCRCFRNEVDARDHRARGDGCIR